MAHVRQSRPDSGIGFQVKVLKTFPSSLGRGLQEISQGVGGIPTPFLAVPLPSKEGTSSKCKDSLPERQGQNLAWRVVGGGHTGRE